jgi:hypothetical protein
LDRWTEGGGGLEQKELDGLQGLLGQWAEEVRELFSIGLPETLLHPDFRNDNMVHSKEAFRIIDWSDTQISHPFLVLGKLTQDSKQFCSGKGVSKSVMKIDEKLLEKTIAAYLQPFTEYANAKDLQRALILAQGLLVPWSMIRMLDELQRIEPMTPHYYKLVVTLQRAAREAIKQWSS